jgi:hypothetical protein
MLVDAFISIHYLFFGFCGQVATRCPSSLQMKHFIGPKLLFPAELPAAGKGGGGGVGWMVAGICPALAYGF